MPFFDENNQGMTMCKEMINDWPPMNRFFFDQQKCKKKL